MTLIDYPGINKIVFTANLMPKTGDREDFSLNVVGPDPKTNFNVPLTISGTAMAIWGNPNGQEAAEELGRAIFHKIGTASTPPTDGYWFDSYNSGDSLEDTINKIYNSDTSPFIKNRPSPLFVKALGSDINEEIQKLDGRFSKKYNTPFFKSLEDISEESQRVDDLNTVPSDNAGFLYRLCILSGIIDHIDVKLQDEDKHVCTECGCQHKQPKGSLQLLREWLASKYNDTEAIKLTQTFQMIKRLRNQYPIHDHYTTASNIRKEKSAIAEARAFFVLKEKNYGHNLALIMSKFKSSLEELAKIV